MNQKSRHSFHVLMRAGRNLAITSLMAAGAQQNCFPTTFQAVKTFEAAPAGAWENVTRAGDGAYYGVCDGGGAEQKGAIFRVTTNGGYSVVHQFRGADGSGAEGRLAAGTNGDLYGTTYFGGPSDSGNIFKVSTNGVFTLLNFFSGTNGAHPESGMVLGPDGNFYGLVSRGGQFGGGAAYRLSHSGNLQLLASFHGLTGESPNGELCLASDGNFYGTTYYGGAYGRGTVFKLDSAGNITPLANFGGTNLVGNPASGLIQSTNGLLYGGTDRGGTYDEGAVYSVDFLGNLSVVATFDGTNSYGAVSALVESADGSFYGTSYLQVFRMTRDGTISTLYTFTEVTGMNLNGGLLQLPDGKLLGTAYYGGPTYRGIVYTITPQGALHVLTNFEVPGGSDPQGNIISGLDGYLYGTCAEDGAYSSGTVFRLSPGGTFTNLFHFGGTNGNSPTVLTLGKGGTLYGTTSAGGSGNAGTIFQIKTNGMFASLGSFAGTNGRDPDSLIAGNDGKLYGSTIFGGAGSVGVIFSADTNGAITTLHDAAAATGNYPGWPIQAADGNLFGTAYNGPFQGGVVWRIDPLGNYSILHAFASTDGYYPALTLATGANGYFYGAIDGAPQQLFRMDSNGVTTVVGYIPDYYPTGVVPGPDGNYYGTTTYGPSGGALWAMSPAGRYVRLVSFDGSNGRDPRSLPVLWGDGRIFGTVQEGGPGGGGVVYCLTFASPEIVEQPMAQSIFLNSSAAFYLVALSTNAITYQWRRNGTNILGATKAAYFVTNAQAADMAAYSAVVTSGGVSVTSAVAVLSQLLPQPMLSISIQGTNAAISWPSAYTGYSLQRTARISNPSWAAMNEIPSTNGSTCSVQIPLSRDGSNQFYRLSK